MRSSIDVDTAPVGWGIGCFSAGLAKQAPPALKHPCVPASWSAACGTPQEHPASQHSTEPPSCLSQPLWSTWTLVRPALGWQAHTCQLRLLQQGSMCCAQISSRAVSSGVYLCTLIAHVVAPQSSESALFETVNCQRLPTKLSTFSSKETHVFHLVFLLSILVVSKIPPKYFEYYKEKFNLKKCSPSPTLYPIQEQTL